MISFFFTIIAIAITDVIFTFVFKVKTKAFDPVYWKGLTIGIIATVVYIAVNQIQG